MNTFLFVLQVFFASFIEIESIEELQKKLLKDKECIVAIGISPCIPCEKIKKVLLEDQKKLPDILWIDLKKHPKIRHVFNFKAVPFITIYKESSSQIYLTGEKSCKEYLSSIQY